MTLIPKNTKRSPGRNHKSYVFAKLLLMLKEFELVYNLSPQLSKSQIAKLRAEFEQILDRLSS